MWRRKAWGEAKRGDDIGWGHPLNWRRVKERAKRGQRERGSKACECWVRMMMREGVRGE